MSRYPLDVWGRWGVGMVGGGSKEHDLRTEAHGKFGPTLVQALSNLFGACLPQRLQELGPHVPETHLPWMNEPLASGLRRSCLVAASNIKALPWATARLGSRLKNTAKAPDGVVTCHHGQSLCPHPWNSDAQCNTLTSTGKTQFRCLGHAHSSSTPTCTSP